MNLWARGGATLALLPLLVAPAMPVAAQPAAPIRIQKCSIIRYARARPYYFGTWGAGVPVTDGIELQYVNTSAKTADRVAFAVDYRGDVERIIDVGTFSPGAPIDHTFGTFSGQAYQGERPNRCTVARVRFSDGTTWSNGSPFRSRAAANR